MAVQQQSPVDQPWLAATLLSRMRKVERADATGKSAVTISALQFFSQALGAAIANSLFNMTAPYDPVDQRKLTMTDFIFT
jgi:hypothetical protein